MITKRFVKIFDHDLWVDPNEVIAVFKEDRGERPPAIQLVTSGGETIFFNANGKTVEETIKLLVVAPHYDPDRT